MFYVREYWEELSGRLPDRPQKTYEKNQHRPCRRRNGLSRRTGSDRAGGCAGWLSRLSALRLIFTHTFTLGKILEYLGGTGWEHHEQGGILSVRAPAGSFVPLLSPLLDRMSSLEQRDTRASFLFSVFQPILHCGSPKPPGEPPPALFGHECLMRAMLDGKTVSLGSINSIHDPKSCLDSTVRMIDELEIPHDRVVFEITDALSGFSKVIRDVTTRWREEGRLAADYQRKRRVAEVFQQTVLRPVVPDAFPGLELGAASSATTA